MLEICLFNGLFNGRGDWVVKRSICVFHTYKCLFDSPINYIVCSLLWNLKYVAASVRWKSYDVNKMIASMGFLHFSSVIFLHFQPSIQPSIHPSINSSSRFVTSYRCSVCTARCSVCSVAVIWSRRCRLREKESDEPFSQSWILFGQNEEKHTYARININT